MMEALLVGDYSFLDKETLAVPDMNAGETGSDVQGFKVNKRFYGLSDLPSFSRLCCRLFQYFSIIISMSERTM
jgi:hypothetical protein